LPSLPSFQFYLFRKTTVFCGTFYLHLPIICGLSRLFVAVSRDFRLFYVYDDFLRNI
jgi:hypothetical protein